MNYANAIMQIKKLTGDDQLFNDLWFKFKTTMKTVFYTTSTNASTLIATTIPSPSSTKSTRILMDVQVPSIPSGPVILPELNVCSSHIKKLKHGATDLDSTTNMDTSTSPLASSHITTDLIPSVLPSSTSVP